MGLVGIGREKGDVGFGNRELQVSLLCPVSHSLRVGCESGSCCDGVCGRLCCVDIVRISCMELGVGGIGGDEKVEQQWGDG